MKRARSSRRKHRTTGVPGTTLGLVAAGLGAVVLVAILLAYDHVWVARNRVDPNDPAVRVGGAIRSISGSDAVRRVHYDPAARVARVEATSKYYDATKPLKTPKERWRRGFWMRFCPVVKREAQSALTQTWLNEGLHRGLFTRP